MHTKASIAYAASTPPSILPVPTYSKTKSYVKELMREKSAHTQLGSMNRSESLVALGLTANGVSALYEPGIFVRGGGPDFLTNLYHKGKMISIEMHPVWYLINDKRTTLNHITNAFHKYARRKNDHPELHHIVISDVKPDVLNKILGIDHKTFSDEYWLVPRPSSKEGKIRGMITDIAKDNKSIIKEDPSEWGRDVIKVIQTEYNAIMRR